MTQSDRRRHRRHRDPPVRPPRRRERGGHGRATPPARRWPTPAWQWQRPPVRLRRQPGLRCSRAARAPSGTADTLVNELGLTGLQFINVANGCATAGSALAAAVQAIALGPVRPRPGRRASTSTRAGISTPTRPRSGLGQWYGDLGFMVTTQFFAMKINRYLHDHDISRGDAGEGGGQGLPQRRAQPERLAAEADQRGGDRGVAARSTTRSPSTCCARPTRGRPRSWCAGPTRPTATPTGPVFVRGVAVRTRRFGTFEVFSAVAVDRTRPRARRSTPPGPCTSRPASGPSDVQVAQIQDSESGRRDHAHGRERLLRRRRAGGA